MRILSRSYEGTFEIMSSISEVDPSGILFVLMAGLSISVFDSFAFFLTSVKCVFVLVFTDLVLIDPIIFLGEDVLIAIVLSSHKETTYILITNVEIKHIDTMTRIDLNDIF